MTETRNGRMPHRRQRLRGPTLTADLFALEKDEIVFFCLFLLALLPTLFLAGSSWPRHFGDLLASVAAIPLALFLAFAVPLSGRGIRVPTHEMPFFVVLVALPIAQIVPLPAWLWHAMPAHAPSVEVGAILGTDAAPMALSVTPRGSISALSYVLPLLILHFAMRRTSPKGQNIVVGLIVFAALAAAIVAMAQSTFGPQSFWNFYGTASASSATGFFRSRNHYVALIYMAIPFVFALTRTFIDSRRVQPALAIGTCVLLVVVMFFGGFLSHSRAGMLIIMLSLILSVVVFAFRYKESRIGGRVRWIVFGLLVPTLWFFDREFDQIRSRFDGSPIDDYRGTIFSTTFRAIRDVWPWGSGFGSFVDMYQRQERVEDVIPVFVNFAHNDYLQLTLEGGLVAAALMVAFLVWFGYHGVRNLAGCENDSRSGPLATAALIAVFGLLLHSTVDYPLRNGSVGAVFALATALVSMRCRGDSTKGEHFHRADR